MSHLTFRVLNGTPTAISLPDNVARVDGWYYIRPGQVNGTGPYATKEEAEEAASACPVTLTDLYGALLNGAFRRMTDEELEGYAGIEGEGFIWDSGHGLDTETVVTCDHGLEVVRDPSFQITRTDDNGMTDVWYYRPSLTHPLFVKLT